jgi:Hemolysins and related proteins containing CBS domains
LKEVPIWWQLLLQALLILLNSVFACAEIAVISINDNKVAKLAAQGDKKAVRLAKLTSQPARFLSTIQVAITLSGFMGSAFAADNFAKRLTAWLVSLGVNINIGMLNTISVIAITLILSYFTLVFGELVPKRLAMKKAEKLALGMSGFISAMSSLFRPIVWLLTVSTNGILRLLGIDPSAEEDEVTEEEIRMLVDAGSEKGTIDDDEKEWIQNVFEFDDMIAGEIATHRTDLCILWTEDSQEEWEKTIKESRHTLYPICGESADDVEGILNTKEYFRLEDKSRENVMAHAVTPAYFVLETVRADTLFRNMRENRTHFAVVLDEYGGVTGVATMSDLLEQLVGDLDDDQTEPSVPDISEIAEDEWMILGATSLDDVEDALKMPLPVDEYDTFGGFVLGTYGNIPGDGEFVTVDYENLQIRDIEVRDRRVEHARVKKLSKQEMKEQQDAEIAKAEKLENALISENGRAE